MILCLKNNIVSICNQYKINEILNFFSYLSPLSPTCIKFCSYISFRNSHISSSQWSQMASGYRSGQLRSGTPGVWWEWSLQPSLPGPSERECSYRPLGEMLSVSVFCEDLDGDMPCGPCLLQALTHTDVELSGLFWGYHLLPPLTSMWWVDWFSTIKLTWHSWTSPMLPRCVTIFYRLPGLLCLGVSYLCLWVMLACDCFGTGLAIERAGKHSSFFY